MASAQPITDHQRIRRWAEDRGAHPACVKGTGGKNDTGMIRLDFPGYSGKDSLQEISWKEWFRRFDESGLALLVQERTARGQKSNFNKLVSRETAAAQGRTGGRGAATESRSAGRRSAARQDGSAGRSRKEAAGTSSRSRKTASGGSRSRKTASGSNPGRKTSGTRSAGGAAADRGRGTRRLTVRLR